MMKSLFILKPHLHPERTCKNKHMKYDTHFDLVPISDILPTISAKAM